MTVDAGGEIKRNATLRSVTQGRDGLIRLEFADSTVVHAHKVILAMPKRSLQLLDSVGPLFDPGNAAVAGLLFAGCGSRFDPTGPCTSDGNVPGAFPELESVIPKTFRGGPPRQLDSGRTCSRSSSAR